MLVFLLSVFPFIFNTFAGVRSTDRLLINVVRSFGGHERDLYLKVIFPSSLPYIVAGARIALGRGLVGIIVGEFYAASEGIGFAISRFGDTYKLPEMFAGILVLMIAAVALTEGMRKLEDILAPWRASAGKPMNRLVNFYHDREHYLLGWGFILILMLAWEADSSLVAVLPRGLSLFFTTPTRVIEAFYQLIVENKIQHHFYVSSVEFLLGLALAIAVGLPLGLITGRSRTIDALVDPYVTVLNATPRLIFLPLFIPGSESACGRR